VLDFSLVPDLKTGSFIVALGSEIERDLSAFPRTLERAWGAMYFCYNISGSRDTLRATEENLLRAREASL
jgi:hypothetical protein